MQLDNNVCMKILFSLRLKLLIIAQLKVHFWRLCDKFIYDFNTHLSVVKLNKDNMQSV